MRVKKGSRKHRRSTSRTRKHRRANTRRQRGGADVHMRFSNLNELSAYLQSHMRVVEMHVHFLPPPGESGYFTALVNPITDEMRRETHSLLIRSHLQWWGEVEITNENISGFTFIMSDPNVKG